jgi:hypothetical protein
VPDWSVKVDPIVVLLMVSESVGSHIGSLRPRKSREFSVSYTTSGIEKLRVSIDCSRSITCQGIFLDAVDGLGGLPASGWRPEMASNIPSTSATNTTTTKSGWYEDGDVKKRLEEICRCFVLDRRDTYPGNSAPLD